MRKHLPLWLVLLLGLSTPAMLLWLFDAQPAVYAAALQRPLAAQTHIVGGACGVTIQACIDSATDGDTVRIPAGEYSESLTLAKKVSLVGAKRETTIIRALSGQRTLTVSGSGIDASVVISGLTFTGVVDPNASCDSGCGGLLIVNDARPVLQNLLILNNVATDGGGLNVTGNSPLQIANSRFEGNHAIRSGGGLYIDGNLAMTATDFIANSSGWFGGNGALVAGNAHISKSRFIDNYSTDPASFLGGALVLGEHSSIVPTFYLEEVEFRSNRAPQASALRAYFDTIIVNSHFEDHLSNTYSVLEMSNGTLTLIDTDFISNTSTSAGAVSGGQVTVIRGRFEDNHALGTASGQGGALHASNAFIDGTIFVSNTAPVGGGALYADATAQIRNAQFIGNAATNPEAFGGAIYAGQTLYLTDTLVLDNVAGGFGGGVYSQSLYLTRTRLENNQADGAGGGALAQALWFDDVEVINNRAAEYGGGVAAGRAHILNSHFEGNQVLNGYGGGLSVTYGTITTTVFLNNHASGSGGGVVSFNSTFADSRFEGNEAEQDGGGVWAAQATTTITRSLFLDNMAGGMGGGLFFGAGNVDESHFSGNHASRGGAVAGYGFLAWTYFTNILFTDNTVSEVGAALYSEGNNSVLQHVTIASANPNAKSAIHLQSTCGNSAGCTGLTMLNSIIANHAVGLSVPPKTGPGEEDPALNLDYLLFSDVTQPIDSTITSSPGAHSFRGDADFVDPAQGNYELGAASQARDAAALEGCPAIDLNGAVRPQGLSCDIGAYEAAPVSPAVAIHPAAFSFIAMPGMGQPTAQSLNIANIGVGTLNWSISGDPSWVSGSPSSGSQNSSVAVKVDQTGLAAGIHQGTLTVSGNATNPQIQATVQLEVLDICTPMLPDSGFETGNSGTWYSTSSSGNPLIRDVSEMAGLGAPHGGQYAVVLGSQNNDNNELAQDVKLPSGGALKLEYYYQIASNEDNCNFDSVRVLLGDTQVAVHNLCPANNTNGWQKGTIDLAPFGNRADRLRFILQNDALGNPSTFLLDDIAIVAATSAVCEKPILGVSPTDLSFTGQAGRSNPAAKTVDIKNQGTGSLPWTAQASDNWITLNSSNGNGDAQLQVGVTLAGLTAGNYSGQVTIQSGNAEGSPQTVNVALTVTSDPNQPKLQVDLTSLSFGGQVGGTNPASKVVNISNQGGGTLLWSAQASDNWISVSPSSGNGGGQLQIGVKLAGLAAGDYSGQVTITSAGAQGSPKTVDVSLSVDPLVPQPKLQVNPTNFTFVMQAGDSAPAAQNLAISNAGTGTLAWTASVSENWIKLNASNGTAFSTLQVSVDPTGLAAGDHNGQITISSNGALNSPRTINVLLRINAVPIQPALQVSPSSLSFIMPTGGSTPEDQEIDIANSSTGSLAWTASASANWIKLKATSGNAPATLKVGVNPSGLTNGLQSGQITISSPGAESSPQVVDVYLRIGDLPSAYTFQILASTGSSGIVISPTTDGATTDLTGAATQDINEAAAGPVLTVMGTIAAQAYVSINDNGQVAFVGQEGNSQGLYVAQPNGSVIPLTSVYGAGNPTYGPGIQINNKGSVVAVDSRSSSGHVNHCLRRWEVAQPNQQVVLASAGNCDVGPSQYNDIYFWPSISNMGDIVFSASDALGTHEQLGAVGHMAKSFGLQSNIRPVVADTGVAAVYLEKPNIRIARYKVRPTFELVDTVAAVGSDFSAVGHPGISDDGRIIVFYGDLTIAGAKRYNQEQTNQRYADKTLLILDPLNPGAGIFAMVQTDVGLILKRIAGKSGNGYLDPGETYSDNNKNGNFDLGEKDFGIIDNFDTVSRPSVSNFDRDLSTATVVFKATGINGMVGIYSNLLAFGLTSGLFPGLQIKPNRPSALASFATTLVTEKTKKIDGISGNVQDIQIYDSINNKGDIAFWVKMSTGEQRVVLATPRVLDLRGLEVIQVVQDLDNSVALIEGKPTLIRAHLVPIANRLIKDVRAVLIVRADGKETTYVPQGGSVSLIRPGASRDQLLDSINFEVDSKLLKKGVEFQLKILSDHVLWCNEPADIQNALESHEEIQEKKDSSSQSDCRVNVEFEPAYPLAITMFGVNYPGSPNAAPPFTAVEKQIISILPVPNQKFIRPGVGKPITPLPVKPVSADELQPMNAELQQRQVLDLGCRPLTCSSLYLGVLLNQPNTMPVHAGKAFGGIDTRGNRTLGYVASSYFTSNDIVHEIAHTAPTPPFDREHDYRMHVDSTTCIQIKDTDGNSVYISGDRDDSYPFPSGLASEDIFGTNAYLGFDSTTKSSVIPLALEKYGDLMTYCELSWISEYTYEGVYSFLKDINTTAQAATTVSPSEPLVSYSLVSGQLQNHPSGSAIEPLYQIQAPGSLPLPAAGPYTIRFDDATGSLIASYPFAPEQDSEGGAATTFVLMLPYHANAAKVVLLKGNTVLTSRSRSANPPTVTVTAPNGGESFSDGKMNITWNGSDPDGNPLTYVVQYSGDKGTTWQTLALDLQTTNLEVDLTNLPGGSQSLVRVRASDGFNTAEDQSDAVFQVTDKAPWVTIDNVPAGQAYSGDQTIVLYGSAYDLEESQLADEHLIWRSNLDGDLGHGPSLAVNASDLKEGTHSITLVATDGSGNQGSASTQIQVTREYVARAAALSAAPDTLYFAVPNGSREGISNTLYIRNSGDGDLTWSASSNQPWLVLDATTGQAPYNLPVGVLPTGLTQGLHSAEIVVTAGDQQHKIAVEVEVGAILHAAPEGLRFEVIPGQSIVLTDTIAIFNSDESVGDWSASSDQPWLQLSATKGKTPSTLTVSINPAGLALGNYDGKIHISEGEQSMTIDVVLAVTASSTGPTSNPILYLPSVLTEGQGTTSAQTQKYQLFVPNLGH